MSGAQMDALIGQLLLIAGDYRQDDPERRLTRERAENWLSQFPSAERNDILSETVNLVGHAYVSRGMATNLLKKVLRKDLFGGSTIHSHCKTELARTGWLVTQPESSSQADLLRLLDEVLDDSFRGLARTHGDHQAARYVLLDDALFTGITVRDGLLADHHGRPVIDWTPTDAEIWVVVPACFKEGWAYAKQRVNPHLQGRRLERHCHGDLEFSGREGSAHDVLWPTEIAIRGLANSAVNAYVAEEQAALTEKRPGRSIFREGARASDAGMFSSVQRRDLIEARFLEAGVRIRAERDHELRADDRPLGFEKLKGLGFGAPVITYRNAPNNAPLVLHEGPLALFPRANRHRAT